jgi:hypothetical protein
VPSGPRPEAWEQQSREGTKAFEAFAVYRDAGADRSIREVARQLRRDDATLFGWSSAYRWVDRARQFDAHNDRQKTRTEAREREAMRVRQIRSAQRIQATALEALQELEADMLTTGDVLRYLEVGIKLERLVRGTDEGDEAGRAAYQALWERLGGAAVEELEQQPA